MPHHKIPASYETLNRASVFVGKSEWRRPLGRPRRRWKDNIRTDHREVAWETVD
jgi:hypothetical protein